MKYKFKKIIKKLDIKDGDVLILKHNNIKKAKKIAQDLVNYFEMMNKHLIIIYQHEFDRIDITKCDDKIMNKCGWFRKSQVVQPKNTWLN